ncbi:hypothetical protein Tsubulata_050112 [Turnera subulata]|uniref:Arogenate dehydratase n=1 Tax=Turnera subulata TaxID=218843 RepID=A0A9Q0FR89_9ROSI|nr:hypothetical protein Tsubulata_050112 [Turnera subulata]
MAAFVARSPVTPLRGHIAAKPSPPNQPQTAEIKPPPSFPSPLRSKRRLCMRLFASSSSGQGERNKTTHNAAGALHLDSLLPSDTPPFDASPRDSLPRPLSSTLGSNPVPDGSRLRVAYQGVRGAYSESAAEKAYPNCEAVPCEQFDTAFEALAQCEHTLTSLGLVREAVDDTAGAAKHVALHKLQDTGAVASSAAAAIYGLNILAEDIQDDCDNVTRFLMLAREPIIPGVDRPFKTSIVFSLEEGPGVLFKALAVFALRQINLTKIESRPLRKQPLRASDDGSNGFQKQIYFDYLFYVDFDASMADQKAQNALRHLKEFATFLRVLGSYPVDTSMI